MEKLTTNDMNLKTGHLVLIFVDIYTIRYNV